MLKNGDLIVAVGKTTAKEGVLEKHFVLAKIVAVGKNDLFAREDSRSKVFKIPKSRCVKLKEELLPLEESVTLACLGDLVLSIVERFGSKPEQKVGVLMEISDVPGKLKMSKILSGDSMEVVPYDSLIVLE